MTSLPPSLASALEEILDSDIRSVTPLGGGINPAARVAVGTDAVFVKWNDRGLPGLFACEADGLARLRSAGAIRVPEVLAYRDHEAGAHPAFLILEYLAESHGRERDFARRFGELLAALHRDTPSPDGMYGLEIDNYLGFQPQPNGPMPDWPSFYRDRRLIPQIERARSLGRLPGYREKLLMPILERIESLLGDYPARPVLIHGDLWSGNFICMGEDVALIDPAAYYGDREEEMAYVELFGGFPAGFLDAYQSAYSLDPGYPRRRPLHQLHALLVHLNHFGEASYGSSVDAVCRLYQAV